MIKNRTRFHAQVNPKFLFNKWMLKYCNCLCLKRFSKEKGKAMATDKDDISEYKRQKLYKNGV